MRASTETRCEKCEAESCTVFKTGWWRLPRLLVLHLNRALPGDLSRSLSPNPHTLPAWYPVTATDLPPSVDGRRCGTSVRFEDELDVSSLLLYKDIRKECDLAHQLVPPLGMRAC